jgi:hypothetical protein
MTVTRNPLHGSGRAALPHPAPTSGDHVKSPQGIRVTNARMNRTCLSRFATCRTRSSALGAPTRFCARGAVCWHGFPLASPLPFIPSAACPPALFGNFASTAGLSDCPGPFIVGVRP